MFAPKENTENKHPTYPRHYKQAGYCKNEIEKIMFNNRSI